MLKEIDELKERIKTDIGNQPTKNDKDSMAEVVKNTIELYKTRNYIINVFKRVELEESEKLKELEELNEKSDWLHASEDEFKKFVRRE